MTLKKLGFYILILSLYAQLGKAQLSGHYTIDSNSVASASNFINFSSAAEALDSFGVNGPVVLEIIAGSGPYTEQVSLSSISGLSSTQTLTIKGNNEVLQYLPTSQKPFVLQLSNVDHITIDSLEVINLGANHTSCIELVNGADSNSIRNCIIKPTRGTGVMLGRSSYSPSVSTTGSYNKIENNFIQGSSNVHCQAGITLAGKGSNDCQHNELIGNTLISFYSHNIVVNRAAYTLVSGNDISRNNGGSASIFVGIKLLQNNVATVVEKNKIHDNRYNSSLDAVGIEVSYGYGVSGYPIVLRNNLIYNFRGSDLFGIHLNTGAKHVDVYHNTIEINDQNTSGFGSGDAVGIKVTSAFSLFDIRNNLIYIKNAGPDNNYGLYYNTSSSNVISNNNLIYLDSLGTNSKYTGHWQGNSFYSLNAWQGASFSSFDQQSVSVDPLFSNASLNDYHFTNPLANNLGGDSTSVLYDFDGKIRSNTAPDIGAYEISMPPINDLCASAITIVQDTTFGNNVEANTDSISFAISSGVWYKYNAAGGFIEASLCGSGFDTKMQVFSGACTSLTPIDSNDNHCGLQSKVSWCSQPSTVYYLLIGGKNQEEGNIRLILKETFNTPSISIAGDSVLCFGDSVLLMASPASHYQWSTGPNDTLASLLVKASGNYSVSVVDSNGCSFSSSTKSVMVQPPLQGALGSDTSICINDTLMLDAGAFQTFNWSMGDTTQVVQIAGQSLGIGKHTVFAQFANGTGCLGYDSLNVIVTGMPSVYLGVDTGICHNETLTIDAGVHSSYLWSTGDSTRTISLAANNLSVGLNSISVEVWDSSSCSVTDTILVSLFPSLSIKLHNDTSLCLKDTILFSAGSFAQYLWSTGSTDSTIEVIGADYGLGDTVLAVEVWDINGCSTTDSLKLTVKKCNVGLESLTIYDMSFIPNPASDHIFLNNSTGINMQGKLELISSHGELVLSVNGRKADFTMGIDISTLKRGAYFLRFTANGQAYYQKIILK